MITFEIEHRQSGSRARTGRLRTPHGEVLTPAFMVVGTQAAVKGVAPWELRELGAQIVLANTYHLYLRPGSELVAELGGLHRFMSWDGPLITDSGGYQVFSLGFGLEHGVGKLVGMFPDEEPRAGERPRRRRGQPARLTRVDEDGVSFTSHIDGSRHRLTPEDSIRIQEQLGADIILAFDEPTSPLHDEAYTAQALERTHRWAQRCLEAHKGDQALLGIVQGGAFQRLREQSAAFIAGVPFEGFAIGGSLGRSKADMHAVLDWSVPALPDERPRHLLGIGEPEDLFECIERGIDLFDCVAPTRYARHGVLYTAVGKLNITNSAYAADPEPIQAGCDCYTCANFSRAYLRHLFVADELLAYTLASLHNLHFIVGLVRTMREAIEQGRFGELKRDWLAMYAGQSSY
jgi:queuine tRNA-ribosyltransferase/7-cyano-7-deazaguanine tRNA-ribosyltransferase